jgi:predicted PurR-regulated permease PerM
MAPQPRPGDKQIDGWSAVRPWIVFGGCVMVVAVLHWARPVLIPLALAGLLTFVLSPAVNALQRLIGRALAAFVVVMFVTGALGLAGWVAMRQVASLIEELPSYRTTIRHKIADVRGASSSGPVGRLQQALGEIQSDIQSEINKGPTPPKAPTPVVVDPAPGPWGLPAWFGPLIDPLAAAGLVIVLVTFMLIERQELRDRLIRLIGRGDPARATRAFSEAGTQVFRQLRAQLFVNLIFGAVLGIALFLIGVPYAVLWASLAAALRFIPYAGPILGAAGPVLVSLAVFPGWSGTFWVLGVIVALELFTNVVLETVLYAGTAGISQAALLVGIAFWTWIWGPLGLLMATPLTVCVVVLGKHLRPIRLLGTLMADTPVLSKDRSLYQRLLAHDLAEASDLVTDHVRNESPETVYDALLIRALWYAEHDLTSGRLSATDHRDIVESISELVGVAKAASRRTQAGALRRRPESVPEVVMAGGSPDAPADSQIFACAPCGGADAVALRMVEALLDGSGVRLAIQSPQRLTSELLESVDAGGYDAVCVIDLSASGSAQTRLLVKRLRAASASLPVLVGWPVELPDRSWRSRLNEAGATYVGTTLVETAERLQEVRYPG